MGLMPILAAGSARLDHWIFRATTRHDRLIGVAILRLFLGVAAVGFYVSDYGHRAYLWGPNGYVSMAGASHQLKPGQFSLYLISDSNAWFELLYHSALLVAVAFTLIGGRVLTLLHAVLLWSIYLRNQDMLRGGDNLAQILLIFMVFTVNNAYLAPGARRRRATLVPRRRRATLVPQSQLRPVGTLLHNAAVVAMLIQIGVLYFVAGYLKATAEIWTNGTAMYYISRIHMFSMFPGFPQAMNNAYLGWAVNYFTIIAEIAVPFVIWSRRAAIRKLVTVSLEGMHIGIMALMGLVTFGLIMIGADSLILNDHDYRTIQARIRSANSTVRQLFGPATGRLRVRPSTAEQPVLLPERVGF